MKFISTVRGYIIVVFVIIKSDIVLDITPIPTLSWDGCRSGTVVGRSSRCFSWVLAKRSIPRPDQHRKDIIERESLGTDMLY